ncbi:S1-like domain-containing RNA-binding protein [Pendulispora brunnea]|uniref:S1-like domain-containing RNA-binding protein n=1 Tax=Pendulispora brunnea TaxID=2905690 RepID=A0ABZ2K0D9_9BACT
MTLDDLLGRSASLTIRRFGSPGAFLAVDADDDRRDAPTILLVGPEIPENAETGDTVEVFVHLDSEGRPIATRRMPKVELGEVAFLEVKALTDFGAFVDWGLAKELLVPHKEQTSDLTIGARHPIGLYIDESGRLAGTMRVSEMLRDKGTFELDEWVDGEAWRNDPQIGLFVIVERSFVGLVPRGEPHRLSRGEAARFRVSNVLPDGKIELSLRGYAHQEIDRDAQAILDALSRPSTPRVGDRSSPEVIREVFGLSRKAFKRAAGRLLKERAISIDGQGFFVRRSGGGGT